MSFIKNNALSKYLLESYAELKKVTWPTQELVRKHSILVIGISLFVAFYFGAADYLLNLGVEYLIGL